MTLGLELKMSSNVRLVDPRKKSQRTPQSESLPQLTDVSLLEKSSPFERPVWVPWLLSSVLLVRDFPGLARTLNPIGKGTCGSKKSGFISNSSSKLNNSPTHHPTGDAYHSISASENILPDHQQWGLLY